MSKKLFTIALVVMVAILALPLHVFAMQDTSIKIPFSVQNAKGTVVIEAIDNAPLPEITEFQNVKEGTFIMSYSEPDTYRYLIYQKVGNEDNVTYDKTVYNAIVSVLVDESGELYSVVTISIDGTTDKPDDLSFTNEIHTDEPSGPNKPQTGDDSNLPLLTFMTISSSICFLFVIFLFARARKEDTNVNQAE